MLKVIIITHMTFFRRNFIWLKFIWRYEVWADYGRKVFSFGGAKIEQSFLPFAASGRSCRS